MTLRSFQPRRLASLVDSLWTIAAAPQTLALLLALTALTLAAAAVIPQTPAVLDAAAAESWAAQQVARLGGAGPILRAAGAFDLLAGPWMHALLGLLAFSLALRAAAQVRFLSSLARPSSPPAPPRGLHAVAGAAPVAPAHLAARAADLLRDRFSTVSARDDDHVHLVASRAPIRSAGPLLAYAGGLLLLAGLLLNSAAGWRETGIALAPGMRSTLAEAGGLQLTVTGVTETEGSAGATAGLQLTQGSETASRRIGFARPVLASRRGGWSVLWLSQVSSGPALAASARDGDGRPLLLQSLAPDGGIGQDLQVLFRQAQSEEAFAIPSHDLTFRVVHYAALPEQGVATPVFQVEAYRGDEAAPAVSELVAEPAALQVAGVSLSVAPDRYVEIEAAFLPGLFPLLLGALLLLAGVLLSSYGDAQRAWVDLVGEPGAAHRDATRVIVRVASPAAPHEHADRLLNAIIAAAAAPAAPGDDAAEETMTHGS